MLSKLLKHEIKDTARIIPFLYLLALIASIVAFTSYKTGIDWLRYTSIILLIFLSIAIVIITLVVITMRFYQNLYSREGYLMFTLPLKPHLLLISKTIVSICWLILSVIVLVCSLLVAFYCLGAFESVSLWEVIRYIQLFPFANLLFWIIPLILLSFIYLIGQIFFSITLSNTKYFHKMGAASAILIFIILNFILQILESVFTVFFPISVLITKSGVSLSSQNMLSFLLENINKAEVSNMVLGLGGFVFQVIAVCLLFYFNARLMDKKVSLR